MMTDNLGACGSQCLLLSALLSRLDSFRVASVFLSKTPVTRSQSGQKDNANANAIQSSRSSAVFQASDMHWIFFTQPGVPQEIKEEDFNNSDGSESTYRSKRLMKTFTPYKLDSSDFAELAPLLPIVVILTVLFIVLLVIGFRRWPGMVAGIIAGCLTAASIYLIMCAISGDIPLYE